MMRAPHLDRTDFLLTKGLLVLAAVVTPLATVVVPLGRWVSGRPLTWDLAGLDGVRVPGGIDARDGVSLHGTGVGVRITDAGWTTWAASLLPGIVISAGVVAVAWLVLGLVRRVEDGTPFVAASARRLRLIGTVVLAGTFVSGFVSGVADAIVSHRALRTDDFSMSVQISFVSLVAGLLVLALAEAFAQGVRLQDDVEGLV